VIDGLAAPADSLADSALLARVSLLGEAKRLIDALGVEATAEVARPTVMPTRTPRRAGRRELVWG
jgi:hypothetical protein